MCAGPSSPAPMPGGNQSISNLNADNHSQLFAGRARDVYFSQSENLDNVLDSLPVAADAPFNAYQRQHDPTCLPETRVSLREEIYDWAKGRDERFVFWLNGLAGTGKSTIARTVARTWFEEKRLGASFFFSRGGGDVGDAAKFVTSIAWQLANYVPALQQHIYDAIKERRDIVRQSLRDQWNQLVLGPLLKLGEDKQEGFLSWYIIVIDALDECDNDDNIRIIIHLLAEARSLRSVRLRVFLTSRPEVPIRIGLIQMPDAEHQDFILHNIPHVIVNHDIRIFLEHSLKLIAQERSLPSDWPGRETIERLVQNASGLFIWAATAYHFIRQGKKFAAKRLDQILEESNTSINAPEKHLNSIYITVLRHGISPDYTPEEVTELVSMLRSLLGSIITLLAPLSTHSLSNLLGIRQEELQQTLDDLHAILDVPRNPCHPLRLHHPSFRDFLFDQTRCEEFWVDQKQTHQKLADSCMCLMSNSLGQDILRVNQPGKLVSEVETSQLERHLPPEVQYACLYWIEHILRSEAKLYDDGKAHRFFQKHLLHWLEALGWLGKVPEGVHAIIALGSSTSPSDCPRFSDLLYDAKRFILYNRPAIEQAPLQTYSSALVFAPTKSIIRKNFENCIPGWIRRFPKVEEEWDTLLQTLEGHTMSVNAVIFSPDGKTLASASDDLTVKIWDAGSGATLHTLEGHSTPVRACAFLPNSKTLISLSTDREVRVWNSDTGELLIKFSDSSLTNNTDSRNSRILTSWNNPQKLAMRQYMSDGDIVSLRVSSPDGRIVALIDGGTLILYDCISRATICELRHSLDPIKGVIFSLDSKIVASLSDYEVQVWNTRLGNWVAELPIARNRANAAVFSPNNTLIALVSGNVVEVWNIGLRTRLCRLYGHLATINAAAFSPSGEILVSMSDESARVWNTSSGAQLCALSHLLDAVKAVAFSPNGGMLAFMSRYSATVWNTSSGAYFCELKGSWDSVKEMVFSPGGMMLASVWNTSVKVWNISLGAKVFDISGLCDTAVFSPDCKLLATASEESVRVWNTRSGAILYELSGRQGLVKAVAFSPDGGALVSVSEGAVRIWGLNSGTQLCELLGLYDDIAFSPDGKSLATASRGVARVWSTSSGTQICELSDHGHSIKTVYFSPDSKTLMSMSDDLVKVWNITPGVQLYELSGRQDLSNVVTLSSDGKLRARVSHSKIVQLDSTTTREAFRTLEGHSSQITALDFSPDARLLVSASRDKTIKLWDTSIRPALRSLEAHWDKVTALTFSPDGTFLASASTDYRVKLWDTNNAVLLKTFTGHSAYIKFLLFSPDSRLLASSDADHTICLRKTTREATVKILKGYPGAVYAMAFSPDSKILAAVLFENTIKLWDTETGGVKETIYTQPGYISEMSFSSDSMTLASTSGTTIEVWDIQSGTMLQTLQDCSDAVMDMVNSLGCTDLFTMGGLLPISPLSSSTSVAQKQPSPSIFIDKQWAYRNNKQILWLPPNYRPCITAVNSGIIGLGYTSGGVIVMELAF